MAGFTKLHASILDSSVWGEPHHIRIVWITMLAMANAEGVVEASVTGLARRAVVTIEEAEQAIAVFAGPDRYSRDGTSGERVEVVPGGWLILNHRQYRDKQTDAQADVAARVRRHRERLKARQNGVTSGNGVTPGNAFPLSEAEAEAEAEEEKDSACEAHASGDSPKTAKSPRATPFDRFWGVVHQRVGKQASKTAYDRAIKRVKVERPEADPHAFLVERMTAFAASPAAHPDDHTPIYPATWLNGGRYDDDESLWSRSPVARNGHVEPQEPQMTSEEKRAAIEAERKYQEAEDAKRK